MNLNEEFALIQKTLGEAGFKLAPMLKNSMEQAYFIWTDSDLQYKVVDNRFGSYKAWFGDCLVVRRCSHRNGAKFDTSYYLEICEAERSSFKTVKKIKLKSAQIEKTLVKKINEMIRMYQDHVEGKALAERINAYITDRTAR